MSGWGVRAVGDRAEGAAGTPVDAAGPWSVGSAGFDRRADCVDTIGTGDNSVRHSCCHWRMGPSRAVAGMRRS